MTNKTIIAFAYRDRHSKFPLRIIISYPNAWGGQFKDRWMWMAELGGQVLDYNSKRKLKNDAISRGQAYVILRVHKNGNASVLEIS